jgi:signal transduction histidine kinase
LWYDKENNYNENLKLEYPCKRSDDSYIWIQNNMVKIKSNENNNYILGIIENIDERKKNEESMTKLYEELKDLNINKDKFFSIIAHDLRGPFNNLLGFSKVLQDDLDILSKDEMREYSGYIYTSSRNVYDLVENLLQWSRIQTGRMEYQPIKIDLYEEIFKITELFRSNAIAKKINLINEVNNNLFVYADQNMLHSVLQNLLSNAIKFTNSAGNIILEAESLDDFIEISISDTGIGIKKDDMKKLFRIDIQFTNPGTENEEGTGLGLILCKELIEKNKGVIRVESIHGKGSKFTFSVPKWTTKYFLPHNDTLNG